RQTWMIVRSRGSLPKPRTVLKNSCTASISPHPHTCWAPAQPPASCAEPAASTPPCLDGRRSLSIRRAAYFLECERDLLLCRFERGCRFTCTPEWRASERPIAIACFRLFAV